MQYFNLFYMKFSHLNCFPLCRFKLKYHPEDATKRREEQRSALKRRIEVYQKFLDSGKLESVTVDQDQSDAMVKLLDSVVILLEGGSDFDLQVWSFRRFLHFCHKHKLSFAPILRKNWFVEINYPLVCQNTEMA